MVEAADNATDSRVESLNIGRKRVEERCNAPGPLFTERVLLSMGPLKGTRMKGRVRRGDEECVCECVSVCCAYIYAHDVSFLLNFSRARALHPLNCALVRAFSIVPPSL